MGTLFSGLILAILLIAGLAFEHAIDMGGIVLDMGGFLATVVAFGIIGMIELRRERTQMAPRRIRIR